MLNTRNDINRQLESKQLYRDERKEEVSIPPTLFNYSTLYTAYENRRFVEINTAYLQIENPIFRDFFVSGWKIHISVDPDKISDAFNLISPILFELGHFKVISDNQEEHENALKILDIEREKIRLEAKEISTDPEKYEDELFYNSYRKPSFTLYLFVSEDNQNIISCSILKNALQRISDLLISKNIKPGEYPRSDIELSIPYCSMRYDLDIDGKYLIAISVDKQFNPLCLDNPYKELVKDFKDEPFDPVRHFHSLPRHTEAHFKKSISITIQACLMQYLDSNKIKRYKSFSSGSNNLFKSSYCQNSEIKARIYYLVSLSVWFETYPTSSLDIDWIEDPYIKNLYSTFLSEYIKLENTLKIEKTSISSNTEDQYFLILDKLLSNFIRKLFDDSSSRYKLFSSRKEEKDLSFLVNFINQINDKTKQGRKLIDSVVLQMRSCSYHDKQIFHDFLLQISGKKSDVLYEELSRYFDGQQMLLESNLFKLAI